VTNREFKSSGLIAKLHFAGCIPLWLRKYSAPSAALIFAVLQTIGETKGHASSHDNKANSSPALRLLSLNISLSLLESFEASTSSFVQHRQITVARRELLRREFLKASEVVDAMHNHSVCKLSKLVFPLAEEM